MATAAPVPDAVLVGGLHRRQRAAWQQLYAAHSPALRGFALHLTGDPHDADDLVQETFVRALPRLDELDPAEVHVRAYLCTTLRSAFLKSRRHAGRVASVEAVPEPPDAQPVELDPERSALLRHQRDEVRAAAARLSERQRLALALREIADLSYAEIGEVAGLKENAVAQLLLRARDRLRTELRLGQVDADRLPRACRRMLPALARELDGQLRGAERDAVLAHLTRCADCRASLDAMQETSRRYRALLPVVVLAVDEAQAARIDAELTASGYWERPPPTPAIRSGRRRLRRAPATVTLALVVLFATGIGAALVVSAEERELAPAAAVVVDPQTAPATATAGAPATAAATATAPPSAPPPARTTATPPTTPAATAATVPQARPAARRQTATTVRRSAPERTRRRAPATTLPAPAPSPATPGPAVPQVAPPAGDPTPPAAPPQDPPAADPDPPPPPALPDLVITSVTSRGFTVSNTGGSAAGAFVVTVTNVGTFSFGGLAAGAAETRSWPRCIDGLLKAVADRAGAVAESAEGNNIRSLQSTC